MIKAIVNHIVIIVMFIYLLALAALWSPLAPFVKY